MPKLTQLWRRVKRPLINYRTILRDFSVGVAAVGVATVIFQLAYPADNILPSVEVQGYNIGGQKLSDAENTLGKRYGNAKLVVLAGDKKVEATLAEAGIDVDKTSTIKAAGNYPAYQRFIPFSSLFIMIGRDTPVQARYDKERLDYFAGQVSSQAFVPSVDAGVTVEGGKAKLLPSKPSSEYPAKDVAESIRQAGLLPRTEVKLKAINRPAQRTDDEVKGVLETAQEAVDAPLILVLNGEKINVDKNTLGGWLDFAEGQDGSLTLALKEDGAKKYLEEIQAKVYIEPGTTNVKLVDGVEVSRTAGATGRGIDMEQSLERIAAVIGKAKSRSVELPLAELPPTITYERVLSNTNAGLTALLTDIVKAKGNYAIAVIEMNGLSGKVNGGKQYTAASTFKLFVAYAVFQWINSGKMSWSDPIANGYNAEQCFEKMIVVSDNSCPVGFANIIGWQTIDDMMYDLGLTSTQFSPGNHLTTASDLALFLYKLENGTLLNSGDKARLIDAMKRQIYRQGIPAGTGVTVADKPGFLYGLLHDAGIVYGPSGTYVLVIMSDGSTWGQLADAAKQIHNFLQ